MQIDIIIKDIYYIQLHTLKTFTQHCINVFDITLLSCKCKKFGCVSVNDLELTRDLHIL
jgi:hypothetical protein